MTNPTDDRSVCVVIPMPNDPPWELFDAISDDIPIIVCDDSNGKLAYLAKDSPHVSVKPGKVKSPR